MTRPENELNIDDYYELSVKDRQLLDAWLKKLGGNPIRTRKLTLHDDHVITEEYVVTSDNLLTYNRKTRDVDILVREFEYDLPPPIWKQPKEIQD